MDILSVPVPEVYEDSHDFRFFLKWIALCFAKIQYDTENLLDLYDAQRCPANLLWMLADTIGFKYDDRLPTAYNRLVLLYFMSMIRNRGSKDGMTLAAETNLAQFHVLEAGKTDDILYDRLENTSIPVNSAYVTPHTETGYIDVVYFSDTMPVDACIEYVRPLGMYCFQYIGVRYDARTKISVDARLASNYLPGKWIPPLSIGATHVGHYSRNDYARMQRSRLVIDQSTGFTSEENDTDDTRRKVWYRNSVAEGSPSNDINPGYRALSSLQLCNSDDIFNSLFHNPIFSLGYSPQTVGEAEPLSVLKPAYNLRYDEITDSDTVGYGDVKTVVGGTAVNPVPAVNPVMARLGDAISLTVNGRAAHTVADEHGNITVVYDDGQN